MSIQQMFLGLPGADGYEIKQSLRFNAEDVGYLSKTFSSASNQKTWTWSGWIKVTEMGTYRSIFNAGVSGASADRCLFRFNSSDVLAFISSSGTHCEETLSITTDAVFRDPSAWYHIMMVLDTTQASSSADRLKIYVNGVNQSWTGTGPTLNKNQSINAPLAHEIGNFVYTTQYPTGFYLADVHFIDGQALTPSDFGKTNDATGQWVAKKFSGSYGTTGFYLNFDNTSDLGEDSSSNGNDWTAHNLVTSGGTVNYLDNITGSISNGIDAFSASYISNYINTSTFAVTNTAWIGAWQGLSATENVFTPPGGLPVTSSLIVYYGCYSNPPRTTTLLITYTDTTTETDTFNSGSSNWMKAFTASSASGKTIQTISITNNVTNNSNYQSFGGFVIDGAILESYNPATDVSTDSPSPTNDEDDTGLGGQVRGNYATLSPIALGTNVTLSQGNLKTSQASPQGHAWAKSTIGMTSGKWYAEATLNSANGVNAFGLTHFSGKHSGWVGADGSAVNDFNIIYNNASTRQIFDGHVAVSSYVAGAQWTAGDLLQIAFDADNGKAWFGLNNTWYKANGSATTKSNVEAGTEATFVNFIYEGSPYFFTTDQHNASWTWNFGARQFAHAAPSGFKSLCTQNLPDPTIKDASQYFDVKLWTGNGSSQTISGLNFSPDLIWTKLRSTSGDNILQDTVRGTGEYIRSNSNGAAVPDTTYITAFNSDGFSVGSASPVNQNTKTLVGWSWDAGSSDTSVSVGGLNSSSYDQSQTWSNSVSGTAYSNTYAITKAFDGLLSTRSLASGSAGLTFTPSSAITVNSSLRIYIGYGDKSASNVLKVNGTDYSNLIRATGYDLGWITIPGISSITSIHYGVTPGGSEDSSVSAIEVDGKILVDSGVSVTALPTIATTYRANTSAGFSIAKYTSPNSSSDQSFAHGLGVKPDLVIVKNLDSTYNWDIYHSSLGYNSSLRFTTHTTRSGAFSAEPTSKVVYTKHDYTHVGTDEYVAYCWNEVDNYSKFGSYKGNGASGWPNADGPFVYLGFRPAFILFKCTSQTENWVIYDSERKTYNFINDKLVPNNNTEETTPNNHEIDFLSNGFKVRNNTGEFDQNGGTYVYAAFAESPFKYSNAR